MADASHSKTPRFKVGDRVTVVGLGAGASKGKRGLITELLPVDVVYRYRVKFPDGAVAIFYGFELELDKTPSEPE